MSLTGIVMLFCISVSKKAANITYSLTAHFNYLHPIFY